MNITYYGFSPFKADSGKITVIDTGSQRIYQQFTSGFRGENDEIKLSNENFSPVSLRTGAQWYGDPMMTVNLNGLFQKKLQSQLGKIMGDEQVVRLSDDLQHLLSRILEDSYLMDVPLELPIAPDLNKLIKFSGIQIAPELDSNPYGIIETLIKVLLELNDQRMIVLTNVSHYFSVSQLQSLVRLVADADMTLLLIEFSQIRRANYFRDCCYHYIDSDFVLW